MPPNARYLLGTDEFGRDILSRIIWGSRMSLYVGFGAVALGVTTGALLGLVSGYIGGATDLSIQRVMDLLLAFPMLVLALTIVAALGPSVINAVIAIATVLIPTSARTMRSSVLGIKGREYILAAKALGATEARVLWAHALPNSMAPYIVVATAALGNAILTEATLSFLGLGTPPPQPSWGAMLAGGGRKYAELAPWLAISPGLAISVAVFGFNLLGDALRDVWDPRLRSR